MAENIFSKEEARRFFSEKTCLFIGDSIMRDIYKDLVYLISPESDQGFTPRMNFINRGEPSYLGDKRLKFSGMRAGRDYEETREFYLEEADAQLCFFFTTRCYLPRLVSFIKNFENKFGAFPDVIMMSSALWDINRWGPKGPRDYRGNLSQIFGLLKGILPMRTQVIWMTTPPISAAIRGTFLVNQLRFQSVSMRFLLCEANHCAAHVAAAFGFDVLDMHYHLFHQALRHSSDGIHWNPDAIRMQSNVFMSHVVLSRPGSEQLPANWNRPRGPFVEDFQWIDQDMYAVPRRFAGRLEEIGRRDHRRRAGYPLHRSDRNEARAPRRRDNESPSPKRPRFY